MTIAQSIEFMTGLGFLILGLSYVFSTHSWIVVLEHLSHNPLRSSIEIGGINLGVGLFILGFHWIWQGGQAVTTIIGAFMVFKGTIHLLFPSWLATKLKIMTPSLRPILWVGGFVVFLIGAYVFYGLLTQPGIQNFLCEPFACVKSSSGNP